MSDAATTGALTQPELRGLCHNRPVTPSANVALVRDLWAAVARHDLEAVSPHLAADARWRAVEDGPWNCEGRAAILEVLGRWRAGGSHGRLESVAAIADRVVVGFRPDPAREPVFPLDEGLRYMVVTLGGGQIVEMKGCASRAAAHAYAGVGGATPGSD